ncbi:uncharacterized protein LOC106165322 [Lingula anatina]|uniref:Uncharacterized protein LOC106165322 n=1 Tax=Lingula anatina TaxID=7574 RepID=A0A1S3IL52_LINAN|nr:uncharacterized protein LOC106165322 [Lingula anatina]|eukprot:XP_013398947.1 uncharacterized protein LOC106165322 [Lingula anatina]
MTASRNTKRKAHFRKTLAVLSVVTCLLSLGCVVCCAVVMVAARSFAIQGFHLEGFPRQLSVKDVESRVIPHQRLKETGGSGGKDGSGVVEKLLSRRKRKAVSRKRPAIHLAAECRDRNCNSIAHRELTEKVPGTVENFVRWTPVTEKNTKRGLAYSPACNCLTVRKSGVYYVYAQVHFTLSEKTSYLGCIFKGKSSLTDVTRDEPLTCTQAYPLRGHTLGDRVKQFSGVFQLSMGDALYVAVVRARHGDKLPALDVVVNRRKTYFGGFKV